MLNDIYQSLSPVAFVIGPFTVRWYGLAYMFAFICFALVFWFLAKRWKVNIDADTLSLVVLCMIIGVIVGARVGYIIFYGAGYYFEHPLAVFAFSEGGMSFHGGLAGAFVGGFVAAKITHIPFLTLADFGAVAAPIGLFFGRIANFINGELWGAPTDAPWGVVFGGAAGNVPRQPTTLFEAFLEGVVLFVVMFILSRKRPPRVRGTFIGIFLVMYGAFRFLIEFVRQPDLQLGYLWGGWLTMGQVLSTPMVLAGIGILIYALRKRLPQEGVPVAFAAGQEDAEQAAEGKPGGEMLEESPQPDKKADADESGPVNDIMEKKQENNQISKE